MTDNNPTTDYYQAFGLERDPFPTDRVDNVFYMSPELKRRQDLIKFVIEYSQQLIVVTSAAGAGKSSFARQLLKNRSEGWKMTSLSAKVGMEPADLARALLEKTYPNSKVELEEAQTKLHKYLEFAFQEDFVPILIIDDAENLPLSSVEFLIELASLSYNETEFRIVLFADDRIHDTIEQTSNKALVSSILQSIYIPSFTYKQTAAYINYRLSVSGTIIESPFTEQEIFRIHKASGGLARGINVLARQSMQPEVPAEVIAAGSSGSVMTAVLAIMVLMLGGYIIWQEFFMPQPPARTVADSGPPQQGAGAAVSATAADKPVQADLFTAGMHSPDTPFKLRLATEIAPHTAAPGVTGSTEDLPAGTASADLHQSAIGEFAPPAVTAQTRVAGTGISPAVTEPAAPAAAEVIIADSPLSTVSPPTQGHFSAIHNSDWLYQQAPEHYVLQLISASDMQTVNKIISGHPGVAGQFSGYINYTKSGKPRYVLLFGIYSDRAEASRAIRTLPGQLQGLKPWPRAVAGVQALLDDLL